VTGDDDHEEKQRKKEKKKKMGNSKGKEKKSRLRAKWVTGKRVGYQKKTTTCGDSSYPPRKNRKEEGIDAQRPMLNRTYLAYIFANRTLTSKLGGLRGP